MMNSLGNTRRFTHSITLNYDTYVNTDEEGTWHRDYSGRRTGIRAIDRQTQENIRSSIEDYMVDTHMRLPKSVRVAEIMGWSDTNFSFWVQGEDVVTNMIESLNEIMHYNLMGNGVTRDNTRYSIEQRLMEWPEEV